MTPAGAYHRALQALGFRQSAYKATFAEGGQAHNVLLDLAAYSRAFEPDTEGLTHDAILVMQGRRQAFFRIYKQLKLSPQELEAVSRNALLHAAQRLTTNGDEE